MIDKQSVVILRRGKNRTFHALRGQDEGDFDKTLCGKLIGLSDYRILPLAEAEEIGRRCRYCWRDR